MKRVAIIQARMGSSRLPNKILMPVLGKPMLGWMLERVALCTHVSQIVVATTTHERDDAVERFVLEQGHTVFRGDEEDVLDRYYQAAVAVNADVVIRLTSDCPLLDTSVLSSMISAFHDKKVDFLSNSEPLPSTWPDGMDVSIFSFNALEQAANHAKKPSEREHVTFYFWNHPDIFRCEKIEHIPDWSKYRVTLDYAEDYELLKRVITHFGAENPAAVCKITMDQVVHYLDTNPDTFALNARFSQGIGWKNAFDRDAQQVINGLKK